MSETMHRDYLVWHDGPNKGIKGMMCPWCGAEQTEGYYDMDFDAENIHVRYSCLECGMDYVETYKYEGTYHFTYEEEA